MCSFKATFWVVLKLQWEHIYGLSPVCTLMCVCRWLRQRLTFPQYGHTSCEFPSFVVIARPPGCSMGLRKFWVWPSITSFVIWFAVFLLKVEANTKLFDVLDKFEDGSVPSEICIGYVTSLTSCGKEILPMEVWLVCWARGWGRRWCMPGAVGTSPTWRKKENIFGGFCFDTQLPLMWIILSGFMKLIQTLGKRWATTILIKFPLFHLTKLNAFHC